MTSFLLPCEGEGMRRVEEERGKKIFFGGGGERGEELGGGGRGIREKGK